MPHDFVPLAEHIADALLEADPRLAAAAGDHRFDDRLPDFSASAVADDVEMLRDASAALSQIDADTLDVQESVDHAVLLARVERMLFERTEVREHEWNPLAYNPGALLHGLIARPFAPADERLVSLAARLSAVPDALATAREVLRDSPRVHVETAIGQFAGTARLVRDELGELLKEAPGLTEVVRPLQERAAAELDAFSEWLRDRLDTAERDPRLGRRLWEARLWHTLDTELSAATVLARAEANVARVGAELRAAAAELTGGPETDDTVREAFARLAADVPDNDTIVELAKVSLDEATEFVRAHDLVSLADDPLVIMEMPEFARGVAVAYCDPPGMLEPADLPTFFCISPTPSDWSAARVESFYREYNAHMLRDLTVHEAIPGHFLQLAHARRYRGRTRARAIGWSGPFVEGWAVYAEELMAAHGFGGLPVRLQQLKMQLRMTINAVIDQRIHCDGMPEEEAMSLMMDAGFQEEGEAAGKWRRALLSSTQLSTYFVGYTEVSEVAHARPADVAQRDWHDRMLAHGSPPPRHLHTLLGL
ncbi:DUF885 domain-containing protein [Dactylosporangium sucinum]|uniref:DUF885 domain-containing protein n=1 Tax=Dactylosporangium sucinum TaxID=1424081 RepID=A0A917WND1_9ACTN|nr:DUF885 domain-containing protein [Dactylosporangium sucinum]GGM17075.1 hypothetical protein GCM10007977_017920 [Dactylosporangium sucinum]